MRVIVGAWYDRKMNMFEIEIFDADLTIPNIIKSVVSGREHFGHRVISEDVENYVAFSDGTRLMLSTYPVTHEVSNCVADHYIEDLFENGDEYEQLPESIGKGL